MTLVLNRIDDRLIHGQVVVGWGQPLDVALHRARRRRRRGERLGAGALSHGRPAGDGGALPLRRRSRARCSTAIALDPRPGILLTGDIATMRELVDARRRARGERRRHPSSGRTRAAPAVRLPHAGRSSRRCASSPRSARVVTAQDVPAARAVPARGDCSPRAEDVMRELLPLALLGGLLGLDVVCFPQMMFSRPLVARDARRRASSATPTTGCSSARRSS